MKKLLFIAATFFAVGFSQAQETKFGLKTGVDLATAKVKFPGGSVTSSETGFFVGAFANIGVSERFSVQPELLYVSIKDLNFLSVPVLAKYNVAEEFGILVGPSFNFLLDAQEDKFKLNIDLGAMYNITDDVDVSAKYSLGTGDVSLSGIFIGLGYSF